MAISLLVASSFDVFVISVVALCMAVPEVGGGFLGGGFLATIGAALNGGGGALNGGGAISNSAMSKLLNKKATCAWSQLEPKLLRTHIFKFMLRTCLN